MPTTVVPRPQVAGEQTGRRVHSRRFTRWTLARLGAVAVTILLALWAIDRYGRTYTFFDMKIYHGAMVWWTSGRPLYEFVSPGITLGFTYPPFAALVMAPMAVLPTLAAGWVNAVLSLAALTVLLVWLLVPIADRHGWPRWFTVAIAVPLAGATEPVRETIGFGQVNLILAVLIYLDMVALRRRARARAEGLPDGSQPVTGVVSLLHRAWATGVLAGAGVGLAAAIKLTPGLFIGYFMVTRQWRAAATAMGTALSATAITFIFLGRDSATYFTGVFLDTSRVGEVDATGNQSLAGILARAYDSTSTPGLMWLAFVMVTLAVGLTRAANAHREGDELAAFTLVGLTANVISPISWSHHLVFLIPALVLLVDSGLRRRSAARAFAPRGMLSRGPAGIPAFAGLRHLATAACVYLLFVVSPIWKYEHKLPEVSHYADGLHGALWENSLGIAIIVLVFLLPWRTGAAPAFDTDTTPARRAVAAAMPD